ncbi:nitrate reductase molybdenum cofactor assembly chaperone [Salmonella enterica subsp. enterica serovar Choleraesuis]|nr:nitrate reductase molybdenum cofactor assembly chaperone [Salmonella enterica subsp. enterica serovar Choleraesuis]
MISLKIISCLLEYPDEGLWQAREELCAALEDAPELGPAQRQVLQRLIEGYIQGPLLAAQAEYTQLFDRGRALSLLLFEHVHGESRDRGQAMVDLLEHYKEAGLALNSYELPDHLPLFLEFLSRLDGAQAREWLESIAPILALLGARLHQRESQFGVLFDLLLKLSGSDARSGNLSATVAEEARDDTPAALDAVWEEEQVRFMTPQDGAGCGGDNISAHQQRFSGAVAPQYLNVGEAQTRRPEGK